LRRGRVGRSGQSTVEFGLSAVLLLFILLGLIDLGRSFYFAVGLQSASREGARQASWFDPATSTNPYLYDSAIKNAVDAILTNSGLPASELQNTATGTTCPTPSDGNGSHNPPYAADTYATTAVNQPLLYICYANTPGLDLATAPGDNGMKGMEVNVILVMNFGFASGFMQGALGNAVSMAANTDMTIGGY
jgi:Flp pilus assembly protein TadG